MYPFADSDVPEIDPAAHQIHPEQAANKFMIMGVPGSGKGTQAQLLCERFDWVHVSVGDILRWHIHNHTKLGTAIRRMIGRGEMVTDVTANAIVHQRLRMHDWNLCCNKLETLRLYWTTREIVQLRRVIQQNTLKRRLFGTMVRVALQVQEHCLKNFPHHT